MRCSGASSSFLPAAVGFVDTLQAAQTQPEDARATIFPTGKAKGPACNTCVRRREGANQQATQRRCSSFRAVGWAGNGASGKSQSSRWRWRQPTTRAAIFGQRAAEGPLQARAERDRGGNHALGHMLQSEGNAADSTRQMQQRVVPVGTLHLHERSCYTKSGQSAACEAPSACCTRSPWELVPTPCSASRKVCSCLLGVRLS